MSTNNEGTGGTGGNGEGTGGTGMGHEGGGGTAGNNNESRAEARIRTLSDDNKALADKLNLLDQAAADLKAADAKKRGDFDTLETGYKTTIADQTTELEELRGFRKSHRDSLLARLSDADKEIAEGLSLDKLPAFVERLSTQPAGKGAGGNPGGGGKPKTDRATPEEIRANIANPKWRADNAHRIFQGGASSS